MDKTTIVIILIVVVLVAGFFVWQNNRAPSATNIEPAPMPEGIVFFYSYTCPHCKNVEDFTAQNNIREKIPFISLEVSTSQNNAQLLINTGISCGLDRQSVGAVPLLWDGQNCTLGDQPIIDFFNKKIEEQKPNE